MPERFDLQLTGSDLMQSLIIDGEFLVPGCVPFLKLTNDGNDNLRKEKGFI